MAAAVGSGRRCFAADGGPVKALRIGRTKRHLEEAGWKAMITRILIGPFKTRKEALAAEEEGSAASTGSSTASTTRRYRVRELTRCA
jgi:hypothetical protein